MTDVRTDNPAEQLRRATAYAMKPEADNARLRTLISDAVFHHAEEGRCLWCMRMERRGHSEKCPAFTPDGEIK